MANTVQTYLNKITSAHQSQPKFVATVSLSVGFSVQLQNLFLSIIGALFDLDTPPVGNQLDIIGQLVGVSRNVTLPITDVFFSWDGTDLALGWDKGSWQPGNTPTEVVTLPDFAYLVLIRAKIGANNWDGTTTQLYTILQTAFAPFIILIQDNCNMSYEVAIIGGVVPALTLALLTGGYLPLKPEGVLTSDYWTSVDTNPAFCWDLETTNCQGWDQGSWLLEIPPTNTPT